MDSRIDDHYDVLLASVGGDDRRLGEYRGRPLLVQILRYYG